MKQKDEGAEYMTDDETLLSDVTAGDEDGSLPSKFEEGRLKK